MSMSRAPRFLAVMLVTLFVVQSLAAVVAAGARAAEGKAEARGGDMEPNNRWQDAVPLLEDEHIEGTLLTNPSGDIEDWYIIGVPYGKVINVSMYMEDYDVNDPGAYNFNLELANYDSSYTYNRWENVIGIQYWDGSMGSFYIRVVINYTDGPFTVHTQPGRYILSASFSDPLVYNGASTGGSLNVDSSHAEELYAVNTPPGDNQVIKVRLQSPSTGDFSVSAYNIYPNDGGWYLRNSSQKKALGVLQECRVSGLGGAWYYIASAIYGYGTYTISTEYASQAPDNDNFPAGAVEINDLNPHPGFCDQGVDWVDWWKVEARAGKTITEAYLTFTPGLYEAGSYFHLSVWDRNLAYLAGDWMPQQGGGFYARVPDITVGYDGPVYVAVRALSSGASTAVDFVPSRGWYKLTMNLPNDPPQYSGGLPEVHMPEDTVDESLNLSLFVTDAENDTLTYSMVGSSYHTHPKINATTGQVTLTPEKDWFGAERLRFKVTDDGPGNKWIEINTTVYVDPVNDAPYLKGTLDDIYLAEDAEGRTADISQLFGDVDDPMENLTYGIRVISQDTHPPGANISLVWDNLRSLFRIGPARLQWGTRTIEVFCTDGHMGTVPAATRFNLTITHRNHDPSVVPGTPDPTILEVREHEKNSQLSVAEVFTDPDLPADYANDSLNITVTGMQRLSAKIIDGLLVIDTGTEQYAPNTAYEERLVLTAKDRFGRTASLNITARVVPINDPPVIVSFSPEGGDASVTEGQKLAFRVTATDNDTADLTYAWYRDGIREPGRGGTSFTFQPDYTMGGSVHTIKVVVSDGYTERTVVWNITVNDFNRAPTGSIRSPVNFTKAKTGTFITFIAEGQDEDGDNLTYIWRNDAGVELGRGQTFSTDKLPVGTQTIHLEITDGKANATADCVVIVYKPKTGGGSSGGGFIPGFGTAAAVAAAAFAIVAVGLARRKKA
jgi:hypothetical protein